MASSSPLLAILPSTPYVGDVGGSEKRESDERLTPNICKGDQKRGEFEKFYRDTVDEALDGILPHRKLCVDPRPNEEVEEALDRYFSPGGTLKDLEVAFNCDPELLWKRPEAVPYLLFGCET